MVFLLPHPQPLVHRWLIPAADIMEKNESLLSVSFLELVILQTLMFGAHDNMWSLRELLWFDNQPLLEIMAAFVFLKSWPLSEVRLERTEVRLGWLQQSSQVLLILCY